jgi:hypothetical protein
MWDRLAGKREARFADCSDSGHEMVLTAGDQVGFYDVPIKKPPAGWAGV